MILIKFKSKCRSSSGLEVPSNCYIENKRFDLDTLRVTNRSPTQISKTNDFLGQSEDSWGARGYLGGPGLPNYFEFDGASGPRQNWAQRRPCVLVSSTAPGKYQIKSKK